MTVEDNVAPDLIAELAATARYDERREAVTAFNAGHKILKKGLALDGKNPTILYGYGGFNLALTPAFDVSVLVWLEQGGVYAIPNLRGGGEYGEE